MKRDSRTSVGALGAAIAALALAVGGGIPAAQAVDQLANAPCDSWATACTWNLSAMSVSPVGASGPVYLTFTVPTTGTYLLSSSSAGGNSDPYGLLYDDQNTLIAKSDDVDDLNFAITAYLTAGQTYFLVARHYSGDRSGSFTVTGQPLVGNDACVAREAACAWDLTPRTINTTHVDSVYLKFTAPAFGVHTFSTSNYRYMELSDDQGDWIGYGYETLEANLTAGQDYYLWVSGTNGVTVTAQLPPDPSLSLPAWQADPGSDSTTVSVSTLAASWSAVSNQAWLTVSPSTGTGGGSMTVSVAANNTRVIRSGTVTVAAGGGTATLPVIQLGTGSCDGFDTACTWGLTPITMMGSEYDPICLGFTAPASGALSFTSSGSPNSGQRGVDLFDAQRNLLASDWGSLGRDIQLDVVLTPGQTYYLAIYQDDPVLPFTLTAGPPAPGSLLLSQYLWYPNSAPGSITVTVASSGVAWSASSSESWLTVARSGSTMTVAVAPNPDDWRYGYIEVTAGSHTTWLYVAQDDSTSAPASLSLSHNTWNTGVERSTLRVMVSANRQPWAASSSQPSWLTVSPASGNVGTAMTVTAAANPGPARVGVISVTAGGGSVVLAVTQEGAASGAVVDPPQGGTTVDPPSTIAKIKAGKVVITGKKNLGSKLKAKVSKYTKGVKFSYTWLRNGKKIKGATKATYKLKKADLGKKIRVKVVAKKTGFKSATVNSKTVKIPKKKR